MTEIDRTDLADRVIAVTGAARRRLRRVASGPFAGELTTAQAELVRHVRRTPGCTINEAAGALDLAPNTVSTLVRALSESGHMVRNMDPTDGRVVRLDLTDQTRAGLARWRDLRQAVVADALDHLSYEQQLDLAKGLDALDQLTQALDGATR